MPKSSLQKLIAETTAILTAHGISVRRDRGVRNGGWCIVEGKRYVILSTHLPPETALELLLESLRVYHCTIEHCSTELAQRLATIEPYPAEANGQQSQYQHRASPKKVPRSEGKMRSW